MRKGVRYWALEILENVGLPVLGIILLGLTFFAALRLPWWAPLALLAATGVVGRLWLRPKRR